MGILGIFRGRFGGRKEPEELPQRKHVIHAEKMPQWLDEQFGNVIETARKNARKISSEAMEHLSDARERLQRLEKSSFGGKDKAYAAANMAKDSFVKRTYSIMDGLRFSDLRAETYSGFGEFNEKLRDVLKEINKASPKQLFLLSRYFRDESRKFMGSIRSAEEKVQELDSFLGAEGKIIKTGEGLQSCAEKINALIKQSSRLKAEEKSIQNEISRLEDSRKESKKRLEKLLGSMEWKELKGLEESVQKKESKLDELESSANEILANAKRPLKKLRHLLESRDAFPENPFRDVVLGDREAWLAGLLKSAVEHARDGSISLKEKEAERIDYVLSSLDSEIPKMKGQYKELAEKIGEERRGIEKFDVAGKKAGIGEELGEIEEELKKQWAELDSKIRERKNTETEIQEAKAEAEGIALDEGQRILEIRLSEDNQAAKI